MPAEIERKFLLTSLPDAAARAPARRIEQGYVAIGERTEVRLRRAGGRMTMTAKRGHGERREEHELALYREQFEALWPLTAERRLVKTRRLVSLGETGAAGSGNGSSGVLVAEVDVYEGDLAGLATVEVEFDSAARSHAFDPPAWFGAELTGNPAYANQSLAAHGLPANGRATAASVPHPASRPEAGRAHRSRAFRLKRREEVGEGLRRVAAGRVAEAAERLREAGTDAELARAVHGARKDLKKARAVLRLARGALGEKRFKAANRRLRDAGRLLAASRDAEVKLQTLRALEYEAGAKFPAAASLAWFEALEAERERVAGAAQGKAREQIGRAAAAIAATGPQIEKLPLGGDSWRLIGPGLERDYREGRAALKRARREASTAGVHELRKRTKDLLYQLRLLRQAWPGLLDPTIELMHELAGLLGEHHDLAVLAEDLERRSGAIAEREHFAALIEARQERLLGAGLGLGARIYAEKPRHFDRRLRTYWRTWRR